MRFILVLVILFVLFNWQNGYSAIFTGSDVWDFFESIIDDFSDLANADILMLISKLVLLWVVAMVIYGIGQIILRPFRNQWSRIKWRWQSWQQERRFRREQPLRDKQRREYEEQQRLAQEQREAERQQQLQAEQAELANLKQALRIDGED